MVQVFFTLFQCTFSTRHLFFHIPTPSYNYCMQTSTYYFSQGLSLKRGFGGCDVLGGLGGFNGLGGCGGFDGLGGFDRFGGFDGFSGFVGFGGFKF